VSVEEARKVIPDFTSPSFVPPPRTIEDITAILDEQKLQNPQAAEEDRRLVETAPPDIQGSSALAEFHYRRALAARRVGRMQQEIADLKKAVEYGGGANARDIWLLRDLAIAEVRAGSFLRAIGYLQRARAAAAGARNAGALVIIDAELAMFHAWAGDIRLAEAAEAEARGRFGDPTSWRGQSASTVTAYQAKLDRAAASVLYRKGRFAEAELAQRRAVERIAGDAYWGRDSWLDQEVAFLSWVLLAQGRLLEAENEARRALLGILGRQGRYSAETTFVVRALAAVLKEQGRYAES
jgi:tetratricopeptide (TPR) repeat protein